MKDRAIVAAWASRRENRTAIKGETFIVPKCQASRGVKKAKFESFKPIVINSHSLYSGVRNRPLHTLFR